MIRESEMSGLSNFTLLNALMGTIENTEEALMPKYLSNSDIAMLSKSRRQRGKFRDALSERLQALDIENRLLRGEKVELPLHLEGWVLTHGSGGDYYKRMLSRAALREKKFSFLVKRNSKIRCRKENH